MRSDDFLTKKRRINLKICQLDFVNLSFYLIGFPSEIFSEAIKRDANHKTWCGISVLTKI